MRKTVETPWGPSQTENAIAPGVTLYTTASHGGYFVAPEVRKTWPKELQEITPFNDNIGWYEEDEDWTIVALAMPHLFSEDGIFNAVTMQLHIVNRSDNHSSPMAKFLASDKGKELRQIADNYVKKQVELDMYRQGSGHSDFGKSGNWIQYWNSFGAAENLVTKLPTSTDLPYSATGKELREKYNAVPRVKAV